MLLMQLFAPQRQPALLLIFIIAAILLSVAVLVALHRGLGPRGRRALIMLVTFVGGLFFGIEYFLPVGAGHLWPTAAINTQGSPANFLTPWINPVTNMLAVVLSFTVGLGVYSLIQVHGRNLLRARPGWHNSLAFFVSMILMFAFGLWEHSLHLPEPPPAHLPWPKQVYELLFTGLYAPLLAATFSLLAFYIASAAYRAFRVRTVDAALMMVAAFIVMLGQVPVGAWLTNWIPHTQPFAFLRLENFGDWVMRWLNSPAQRAITLGVAVGALAMSLRIWLSLERGTFFSEQ